ncbi:LRR receptor-like serine/threonine-protein kinase GSO1 isoform X2 [Durio zibethinus]|uniref:LRR receptor-like serine/threonine-protein kinase GSO1 isoform X2 n=1 Tax=Durio zibethinus TaxID=66656 RepID=A0A6P6A6J5_DURZI|nr:LRR receptor-like serine/threonine-protein kinase GSO1 isoform X2 [Durio zibethinus]
MQTVWAPGLLMKIAVDGMELFVTMRLAMYLSSILETLDHIFDDYGSAAEFEGSERSKFGGKMNPSLLMLKHLSYLDLSNNAFGGIPIPKFLGSIESLRYLSLSRAGFGGLVPYQLGNLSSLQYLNLHADIEDDLSVANLQWLSGLSLLEHLNLDNVNLRKASNWLQVLNTLPSLEKLVLSSCQLPPVPSPTNLNLSSLAILDLSSNSFENPSVLSWIFHLTNLISLDLSVNDLQGCIYDGLENMTSLRHLDLSFNSFNSSIPDWFYNLNSLRFLNLGSNKLHGEISSAIGNMTSAISLDFSGNELEGRIPRSMGNLCKLKYILYSGVNLSQDISDILEILSGCVSKQLDLLDLSRSQLFGELTNQLGNFKILEELYLSGNSISGPIPLSIGELSSLSVLELDQNKLTGQLPESFGQLANLEIFNISKNLLAGFVSEMHLGNLAKLKEFDVSDNPLTLKTNPDWIPPFELEHLVLRSLDVGSKFPLWLRSQKHLRYLDISNCVISDSIPSWFRNSFSHFHYVNLSNNQIHGQIPSIPWIAFGDSVIDLSFNNFTGPLPQISSNLSFLDLSSNFLSGYLFDLLCFNLNQTMGMETLNLGENRLSGEIPACWMKWQNLMVIRLDSNNFTGRIPSSLGTLYSLLSLQLQKNHLSGEIPSSLRNCTGLLLLDFGQNELYGHIPEWIGHSFRELTVLSLRSNKFSGHIPDQICAVSSLQVLDLANNNLVGSLPGCLGEIPKAVTSLFELQSLNLSHNLLTGTIPKRIGEMRSLESVDFSVNKLSGSIPKSMSNLTFLSHMNLSYNNLTGQIPSSTQLQSFDQSSYVGNQLCGLPLPEKCSDNGTIHNAGNGGGENGFRFETDWFYLGMAFGFVIGFWSVFGPLVFDRRWRSMYTLSSFQPNVENQ